MLVDIGPMHTALRVAAALFAAALVLLLLIALTDRRTACRRGVPTVDDDPRRLVAGRVPGMRARRSLTRGERCIAAADLVDLLAGDGMWCRRADRSTVVWAYGRGGEYAVHVGRADVGVAHSGPDGVAHLGRYPSTYVAALALAAHQAEV